MGENLAQKEYKVCKSKVGMKDSYVIRLQLIFRCPIMKKLGGAAGDFAALGKQDKKYPITIATVSGVLCTMVGK
jgi:hypothetical protein